MVVSSNQFANPARTSPASNITFSLGYFLRGQTGPDTWEETFTTTHNLTFSANTSGTSYNINFPGKSGTVALTSDIPSLYLHTIAFQMSTSGGGGTSYKKYDFYGSLQIINYSNKMFTPSTLASYISNIFKNNPSVALNVHGYIYYTHDQTAPKNEYGPVVKFTYNTISNGYSVVYILDGAIYTTVFSSIKAAYASVLEIN